VVYGFSHTHLSGTGCSDYGDILLMPFTGKLNPGDAGFESCFEKQNETASPGFYKVFFPDRNISAELTATARCGFHRYTFNSDNDLGVFLDLKHRDKVLESGLKVVGNREVEGYRISQAWAQKQMVYFVMQFSEPFEVADGLQNGALVKDPKELAGQDVRATFHFKHEMGKTILVKVGISAVSIEGARKNLQAEISGWDFDAAVSQAAMAWNNELGKITVEGGSHDQMVVFNTALYHTMIQPNLYCDVDRQYRGRDLQVHKADSFDYYTVFSLWDTYRAAHPLYTIIDQKRTRDFIQTFLRQYKEGGMLPVWELSGNETGCMIGYHAVPVIADAWLKGIRGYDGNLALEAMKHSANQDHLGLKYYKTKGYIPADKEGESVSKTLEYAFDDWCIAMMAQSLDKQADYKTFLVRAQNYKNIYDRITGFMRAKSNETWFSPFDPAEVNFNYTEANAWQYSFYVPQDIGGLMMLMGGRDKFTEKLDQLFTVDSKTTGREQADISGLIGQYAHGNEPSHHMAYLYNYSGIPWKTQEMVHRICRDFYKNAPDGLIGNEDCGQMSAWYVFSALGFYPVNPASGIYVFGSPVFPKATIKLENGKTLVVKALNLSEKNFYIQSVSLNGKPVIKTFIRHEEIMRGGELVFNMGPEPNKAWGTGFTAFPESYIREYPITPVPAFYQGDHTFMDSTVVAMASALPGVNINFTTNGSDPKASSDTYKRPMLLRKTTTIKAFSIGQESSASPIIEAKFLRIPKNRKIKLNTTYAGQYSAGGDLALIDFKRGGGNFRTGSWQGYEGNDIDAIVDLGVAEPVVRVSLGCMQDQGSWIFMPEEVVISVSQDGVNFSEVVKLKNETDERAAEPVVHEFTANLKGQKVRYIKVYARNRGKCPEWHLGAGGKAWLFADEIVIE
jgi:predicted alpha-1,2-mannosidase